ncbi:hypothetical protein CSUI_005775, partial [Cystoisospora suis]
CIPVFIHKGSSLHLSTPLAPSPRSPSIPLQRRLRCMAEFIYLSMYGFLCTYVCVPLYLSPTLVSMISTMLSLSIFLLSLY